MNTNHQSLSRWLSAVAVFCCAGHLSIPAAEAPPEDFSPLAREVVKLLESGDAEAFAKAVAPSIEDWRAVASPNLNAADEDPLGPAWQSTLDRQQQWLVTGAKAVLAKAAELEVDFVKLQLTAKVIPPEWLGTTRYQNLQAEDESLTWAEKVHIVVTAEPLPDAQDAARLQGEYKLSIANLLKFPGGWRCQEGMRWVSFPATVVDEKAQRELAILAKVAARDGINQVDDPALLPLGEAIARFIRAGDVKVFESEAMLSVDAAWSMIEKTAADSGREGPSREELDAHWAMQRNMLIEPAQSMVALMEQQGIDLKDAEVRVDQVRIQRLMTRGGPGSLEGLAGRQVLVKLAVKSGKTSKSGKNLSGEYVVAVEEALRIGGRWLVARPVRWEQFPAGVVDEKALAEQEFESYVAEHGNLPPGAIAPDIEFFSVSDEQKGGLSDLRGKVVILEFWASWCGPCQEPMAKMQKYHEENPEWKDRVAVVALSIDDTLEAARGHLEKRGWTNTFNVWAGPGGWQAGAPKAFRVRGIPTAYVLDAEGKIVQAGHPAGLRAPEVVNRLLK